jgi:hypothetical protein
MPIFERRISNGKKPILSLSVHSVSVGVQSKLLFLLMI